MMFKTTPEIEKLQEEKKVIADRECKLRSLATAVRMAQVQYFATRDQDSLVRSKSAEAELDKELFGKSLKANDLQGLRVN